MLANTFSRDLTHCVSCPAGEEEAEEGTGFVCGLNVDCQLRALVLRLTPESLAVAFRMVDRANEYAQYSSYWQTRPEVPVRSSPSSWWQHAGAAAKRECRLVSRREVTFIISGGSFSSGMTGRRVGSMAGVVLRSSYK